MTVDLAPSALDREELAELRATVREAGTQSGYPAGVRDLEGADGLDPTLWTLLAQEIGLAGVGLPESAGGLGALAEILAVAEELGAVVAPVPFVSSTVLAGQVLAACGAAGLPWLERIVGGEVAGPALTDAAGRYTPDGVACTAEGSSVTGTVRFVPFGAQAAFYVVAARTTAGLGVYVVQAADAVATSLAPLDFSRPTATVAFDGSPAECIAEPGELGEAALRHGVDIALLATAADQLGGAQACFDMTLDYIKLRRQFNREIGSFQAVKHRMADALALVEMARSGLERVTWGPRAALSLDAAVAKAWASEAYLKVVAETVQLHGGVGFTWEHDAHLYVRRARYDDAFLGNATFQKERIALLEQW